MPSLGRVLFAVYVAATALHIGWIMTHEPFSFDAWNVATDTHAEPFSVGNFLDYWFGQYTHSNPRIGQPLTYLAYKLVWFAPIVTPLVYLAIGTGVVVLGTGRWPRTGRDLALIAIAIGTAWFALPNIGMIMFCRAYGANYVYGAAIQLWFLVPLRVAKTHRWAVPYALLGVIAGMANEHTGPTLCAFLVGYAAWRQWRGAGSRLAWAGAIGVVVGFAAIFFAPGQGERYDGAAEKVSLFGRLLQRGLVVNLDIFRDLVIAAAPLLALMAIALIIETTSEKRAKALKFVGLALAAGAVITITIFVSPKLGPRFYLASMVLLLAGYIGVLDACVTGKRMIPFVVLAVLASGYAALRTIPLYDKVSEQSDERLAALDATPAGSVFTADSFTQVDASWWFLGDDFRDVRKREMVAKYFDLDGVIFRAVDLDAPLGVTDVRLVPRYDLDPPSCLDEHGGLELGSFKGVDVGSILKAERAAIDDLRTRLPAGASLRRLDLTVGFVGKPPALPKPTLLVGRWRPDGFDGWAGQIVRKTSARTRTVVLPKDLPAGFELWIYQVGGEARKLPPELTYTPWRPGAYWVLACKGDECFVIVATRQA